MEAEAEAEGTQTGEAGSEIIPEDVPEVEVPNREGEEDKTPENDVGVAEREERGDGIHMGVPEEELPRVLEQLELSLTMTSMLEEEKMGGFTGLTGDISSVRRRKRRKVKKVSH